MKSELKISTNANFNELIETYRINDMLHIDVSVPVDIRNLLQEEIIESNYGTTLNCWKNKFSYLKESEDISIKEDNENHFHVDHYIDPPNEEQAFKLGVKTSFLLAGKFVKAKLKNTQISYSFHTKEMSRQLELEHGIKESEAYFFGDRISFNRIREVDKGILRINLDQYKHDAMMVLTI